MSGLPPQTQPTHQSPHQPPPVTETKVLVHKDAFTLITTLMAALFNLFAVFVVTFGVTPKLDQSIDESRKNNEVIRDTRRQIDRNADLIQRNQKALDDAWRELEQHRHVIKRLNDLLDAAAKAAEMKRKADEEEAKRKGKKPT